MNDKSSVDESVLDARYFVDGHVYNCPFCKRRHVSYSLKSCFQFDWTAAKPCYGYLVCCNSCGRVSMHLSYEPLPIQISGSFTAEQNLEHTRILADLDSRIFYSVPTSSFVLDSSIPKALRELLAEAEGCLKSNFLTGASACARKVIYELAVREQASGSNYDERIAGLKQLHPEIDATYFDTLLTIQQVTSSKVHEEAYDGWQAKHIRLILGALKEVLVELYVEPHRRAQRRQAILDLKQEVLGNTTEDKFTPTKPNGNQA